MLHSSVQLGDVQSGFLTRRRSSRASGMAEGSGAACGHKEWKVVTLSLDNASAMVSFTPLMWDLHPSNVGCNQFQTMFGLYKCQKYLARCIASLSLEDPLFIMLTTAILSRHTCTVCLCHSLPHITVATTIGTSSLAVMWHC